jgi:hypothetical protein
LTEGEEGSGDASIQVTLHLSTYYRTGGATP